MERRFPRNIDALDGIFRFVDDFFAAEQLPDDQSFDVNLILEELFMNMVRHATKGREPIAITLDRNGSELTLTVRDFDVDRFDVTAPPRTDLSKPLLDRQAGGLGLHIIHRLADGLRYDYADRTSTITVTKRLEI